MAVYVICPHCCHPTVLSRQRTGKGQQCRQCGKAYFVDGAASLAAEAVPVQSRGHLSLLKQYAGPAALPVYEIA